MIITAANQKGGTGKSTLLANLACLFQQEIKAGVLVLDLDSQETSKTWMELTGFPIKSVSKGDPRELEKETDILLIDTPGNLHAPSTQGAIQAADIILIPVNPSPTDVMPTRRTVETIKSLTNKPSLIVINKFFENTILGSQVEGWLGEFGVQIAKRKIQHRQIYQQTAVDGWVQSGPGYEDLKALAAEVIDLADSALKKK